ncbi:HAD-superfamily hydrolase [Arthrobacter crystallopoietes BAB-32]|uniref:HAD-superfamily hydrolase n=2 Tax=Crystallibacter crystallopoietes TaxID=37928 RepID=N1V695_9MICC|nr:HAD-superfamily hydrolase [Arthrobacter crystallopoietes BAB-32]
MDGTLIDSAAAIEQAWKVWADNAGVTMQAPSTYHGRTARSFLPELVSADRLEAELQALALLEENPQTEIPLIAGAKQILEAIPADRWAIVTSSVQSVALARLSAAQILTPAVFITGGDVAKGKPAPHCYELGASCLGVAPADCVAFEDSLAGVQSAQAAGCFCIAVEGTADRSELARHADIVVPTLESVQVSYQDGQLHLQIHL